MTLEPWQRENFERALHNSTTVLENLFWGWLLGHPGACRLYFEEVQISPLEGPGHLTEDFPGEMDSPDW